MMQGTPPGEDRPGPDALPDGSADTESRDLDLDFGAGLADAGAAKKAGVRGRKKASRRKRGAQSDGATSSEDSGPAAAGGATKKKRKRTRRKKSASGAPAAADSGARSRAAAPAATTAAPDGDSSTEAGDDAKKRRRRRGTRGGRRRKKKGVDTGVAVDSLPGEDDDFPELPELPDGAQLVNGDGRTASGKKKRKRSRKKKTGDEGSSGRSSTRKKATKATAKKRSVKKTTRRKEKTPEEAAADEESRRTQVILVNAADQEERRVAVVDGSKIIDFLMTSESQKTLVNDIYRGKVVNLEPAIGAAFVDFGQGRNGFLHTSDVLAMYGDDGFKLEKLLTNKVDPEDWDGDDSGADDDADVDDDDDDGPKARSGGAKKAAVRRKGRRRMRERRPISDLLRVGDPVVVQVTKDAIGDKGPTLTTYISIPGRYLVLMPSMARTGVSRKIPDDKERKRLKRILVSLDAPTDMGVIVRTAGVGKTKTDLQRDLDYLLGVWANFGKRLKSGRGPTPLYQESDVATRTLRDLFNSETAGVFVDDPVVHGQMLEFAEKLMPEHIDRIHIHEGDRPLFHHHGIEQDFEKIFSRRVELPSGGSIVFDQAEALVAIDVNSGRTRTDSFDFEEIALKTNLEAVPEIARQIKLRDLGGILVCDFIDMSRSASNRAVERSLRNELATDRARSKLGRISQFGLLEMTRQRLGPGMHKKVFQTCPRCRGTGRIRSVESRAQAIVRRLGSALTQKGFSSVEVRAHPEVVDYLREDLWDYLRALEHRFEKELQLTAVPDQPEDSVLRYLRADGREVRPGGRRKR